MRAWLALMLLGANLGAAEAPRSILIVNSYRAGYDWTAEVLAGIHDVLREGPVETIVWEEFLDARRDAHWRSRFLRQYPDRHAGRSWDLVILIDDEAVSLICGGEAAMWKSPLLIGGIAEAPRCDGMKGRPVTGTLEHFNNEGLIEVGLRVRPLTKRMVVLTDGNPLAQFLLASAREVARQRGLEVTEWAGTDFTLAEVKEKARKLPPDALLLIASFQRDRETAFLPPASTYRQIAEAAPVPVILQSSISQPGVLAGSPNGGRAYGRDLGRITLRLLAGEAASSIPITRGPAVIPQVEADALERWGVDASVLGPGVEIIRRRRPSFFNEYRSWILGGGAFLLAQSALVIALAFNIAKRRRAQKDLRESHRQLSAHNDRLQAAIKAAAAAAESKSRFMANISHELRTPLHGVMGLADLLAESAGEEDERRHLRTIRSSAQHLLQILNDILDLSLVEAGRLKLVAKPFSVAELVDEALVLFTPAPGSGVQLHAEVAEGVPAQLMGDPLRIRQVLFNLVGNALKFTKAGWVRMEVNYEQERLVVNVSDTGEGIPAEKLAIIFDRFAQADDSSTRRHGGLGLGLSIAQELARAMGGGITAESVVGQGSRFRFEMPAKTWAGESEEAPAAVRRSLGRIRVLVVEDNEVNLMVISSLLERLDCDVTVARNGAQGVAAAGSAAFDVILMDLQMPEMDGIEATRRIRAQGARLPIIALTASAMAGDRERCLAAGFDEHLSKPVDLRGLAGALERWAKQPN